MVTTYGALAEALGDMAAARAVGYMLSVNPDPENVPCYRVVHSDGKVGKYTHPLGTQEKVRRLENDGIRVEGERIVGFENVLFTDFHTDHPLRRLREEQKRKRAMLSLETDITGNDVAAVDVSYHGDEAFAAAVVQRGSEVHVRTAVARVRFPYIPGYLFYREFPAIREVVRDIDGVLLIDGNGVLHPSGFGFASQAGVELGIPTIGVAKSLLMGQVEGQNVIVGGRPVARVLGRHCIVSPGHRVSLEDAVGIVRLLPNRHLYPMLLTMAHREANSLRLSELAHGGGERHLREGKEQGEQEGQGNAH